MPEVPSDDSCASLYDELYSISFGGMYEEMTNAHLRHGTQPSCKVFDVGAGTGRLTLELAHRDHATVDCSGGRGLCRALRVRRRALRRRSCE